MMIATVLILIVITTLQLPRQAVGSSCKAQRSQKEEVRGGASSTSGPEEAGP